MKTVSFAAWFVLLVGGLFIAYFFTAQMLRWNPSSVSWGTNAQFMIVRSVKGEAELIEFKRPDGSSAAVVHSSLDTLCERPDLMLLDVDDDGQLDIYYVTCSRRGYIKYSNGALVDVQVPDFHRPDALFSYAFSRFRDTFWPLLVYARVAFVVLLLEGLIGLIALSIKLGQRKKGRRAR
jgi:hypothetical protein